MVAGDKRRKVEDTKPISYKDLALRLDLINNDRISCLVSLIYLSGRRINEVLQLKKKDFKIEPNRISFETFNEKVFRHAPTSDFTYERKVTRKRAPRDANGKVIWPRKYEYYDDVLFNQKIRPHWRTNTESGKCLTKFVTKTLASLTNPEDYIFRKEIGEGYIHYKMAYAIVRFYFPEIWPHLLRHDRFTEVSRIYKSDPVAMHRFTFHKRFESTLQYIRNLEEEKI